MTTEQTQALAAQIIKNIEEQAPEATLTDKLFIIDQTLEVLQQKIKAQA